MKEEKIKNIKLLHGDCMEYMKDIPDNYFDLAVVDPDFGLNDKISCGGTWASKYKKEDGFLGGKPNKEYFVELIRISKNQIVWGGNYFIDNLYPTRCWLIWDKVAKMDTLADAELAWTSFNKNIKIFSHIRTTNENRIHICQKPVKLYEWLYVHYAKCGDKILDTHLGSGSSAIASYNINMDLDFTGIEIDEEYYNNAVKRIKEQTMQLSLF